MCVCVCVCVCVVCGVVWCVCGGGEGCTRARAHVCVSILGGGRCSMINLSKC